MDKSQPQTGFRGDTTLHSGSGATDSRAGILRTSQINAAAAKFFRQPRSGLSVAERIDGLQPGDYTPSKTNGARNSHEANPQRQRTMMTLTRPNSIYTGVSKLGAVDSMQPCPLSAVTGGGASGSYTRCNAGFGKTSGMDWWGTIRPINETHPGRGSCLEPGSDGHSLLPLRRMGGRGKLLGPVGKQCGYEPACVSGLGGRPGDGSIPLILLARSALQRNPPPE